MPTTVGMQRSRETPIGTDLAQIKQSKSYVRRPAVEVARGP